MPTYPWAFWEVTWWSYCSNWINNWS